MTEKKDLKNLFELSPARAPLPGNPSYDPVPQQLT